MALSFVHIMTVVTTVTDASRRLWRDEVPLYWAVVAFATGIGIYFALPFEPPVTLTVVLAATAVFALAITKKESTSRIITGGLALMVLGLLVAGLRTQSVAAPVIERETRPVWVVGTVEEIEHRPAGGERVLLSGLDFGERWRGGIPAQVRLSIRTEHGQIRPGDRIAMLAIMMPPPEPALPYGYDFARAAWFKGLGGVGFAISPVDILEKTGEEPAGAGVNRLRDSIEGRIRDVLPGDSGAVAVALLTGLRGGLPEDVTASMRNAGLAHLLAISGLHMALVTGIIFFAVRALLALSSRLALKWPIKKIAAGAAWFAGLGYLVLSGAGISSQRAFVMVSVALIAVLVERRAISMRTVAIAALIVLGLTPEALLGASFQMSFSAVVGLIAGFEFYRERMMRQGGPARTVPRKALRYLGMTLLATLIAQASIAPVEIYHFHRIPLIGAAANMVAMPLMSLLVMPAGVLALLLMPLGLEGPALQAMGWGIDVILASARDVNQIPAANLAISSWPHAAFLLIIAAGLMFLLGRGAILRRTAAVPLTVAILMIATTTDPDVLIARDGAVFGVRGVRGAGGDSSDRSDTEVRYYVSSRRAGSFARQVWQETYAEAEDFAHWDNFPEDAPGLPTLSCDNAACLYRADRDSGEDVVVAFIYARSAFEEDCRAADLVITTLTAPDYCGNMATLLDRRALEQDGAATVSFSDGPGVRITSAGSERGQRPWVRGDGFRR